MSKWLSVFDNLEIGVLILNEELEIVYANQRLLSFLPYEREEVHKRSLYNVLPKFQNTYIKKILISCIRDGSKMFLAAGLHKNMLFSEHNFNIKISRFEEENSKFLLVEFIDVTAQFIQIARLRNYVLELSKVNKELKEKEKIIESMAYHDCLTEVYNRRFFYTLAEKYIESAKREQSILGLMFIDINNFKFINDSYGHEAGDKALVQVAKILSQVSRKNDTVARYGGDEFLILLPNLLSPQNFKIIASRIHEHPERFIKLRGEEIELSFSIGISHFPDDGDSIDQLICKADQSMYAAKSRKKGMYRLLK